MSYVDEIYDSNNIKENYRSILKEFSKRISRDIFTKLVDGFISSRESFNRAGC